MALAVAGLLVAFIPILAAKVSFIWLSIILAVAGIALGIVALVRARGKKGPKGFTLVGIIAPGAALIIIIVWLFIVAAYPALIDPGVNQGNNSNTTVSDPLNDNNNNTSNTNTNTNNNTNITITVPDVSDTSSTTGSSGTSGSSGTTAAQQLSGEVIGQVGTEYATRWFNFTVNSLKVVTSYASLTPYSGNNLVVANVTITCTYDTPQHFGTYDWFLSDETLSGYHEPIDPPSGANSMMMPLDFILDSGQTATYEVVIEYPASIPNPCFIYAETSSSGEVFTLFKIPIK